jgi:hypothetical protein
MQALVAHWRDGFDWREHEAALNRFAQFTVPLAGIDLHFIHEPGQGPAPLPLLLSHGWPGSVLEFRRLIPLLSDPGRFWIGADTVGLQLVVLTGRIELLLESVFDFIVAFATLVSRFRRYLAGILAPQVRARHSTVTDLARFLGLSTSVPRAQAVWYASSCSGTTCRMGLSVP